MTVGCWFPTPPRGFTSRRSPMFPALPLLLAACVPAGGPERTLEFPADRSVGRLEFLPQRPVEDLHGIGWNRLAPARGAVETVERNFIEPDDDLRLTLDEAETDLSGLSRLPPGVLSAFRAAEEDIDTDDFVAATDPGAFDRPSGGGPLRDEHLPPLVRQTTLWALDLEDTAITDAGVKVLAPLTKLRELKLPGATVTGAALRYLGGMGDLHTLELIGATAGEADVAPLLGHRELRHLRVRLAVGRETVARLAALPELRTLHLTGPGITDAAVAELAAAQTLEELSITHAPVTDAALKTLAGLPRLDHLELVDTRVGGPALAALARDGASPMWVTLGFGGRPGDRYGGEASLAGVERFRRLQTLQVLGGNLPAVEYARLKSLPGLLHLRVEDSPFADAAARQVAGIASLRWLAVPRSEVTDAGARALAGLEKLHTLRLGGRITADGVAAFATEEKTPDGLSQGPLSLFVSSPHLAVDRQAELAAIVPNVLHFRVLPWEADDR